MHILPVVSYMTTSARSESRVVLVTPELGVDGGAVGHGYSILVI